MLHTLCIYFSSLKNLIDNILLISNVPGINLVLAHTRISFQTVLYHLQRELKLLEICPNDF